MVGLRPEQMHVAKKARAKVVDTTMTAETNPSAVPEHPTSNTPCELGPEVLSNLVRAYDCVWSEISRFLQRFDLTPQQYNVLKALASHDGGVACQAIGEQLINRVPDITRLLDRLEQAGFIRRERCSEDRRVVRTYLTDTGRAKLTAVRAPLDEAIRARFGHMSHEDLSALNRLLAAVRVPDCEKAKLAFVPEE